MRYLLALMLLLGACGGAPESEPCQYWSYGPNGTDGQLRPGVRQDDGGCRP